MSSIMNSNSKYKVLITLATIEYEVDGSKIIYCPSLDLIGYGKTKIEAHKSFETVLEEYLKYAENKKILMVDLLQLGWKISIENTQIEPPSFTWLIRHNKQLREIYKCYDFHKSYKDVSIPLCYD